MKITQMLNIVAEPQNKITRFSVPRHLKHINADFRSGISSIHFIDKGIAPAIAGVSFRPYHILTSTFKERISRLFEAGFDRFWFQKNRDSISSEETKPEVLTLDHLEIGFISCAVILAIGVAIFVLEIFHQRVKRVYQKFVSRVVTAFIVREFLK